MATAYLKRTDTRPVLTIYLKEPDGKTAHDLTNATDVTLRIRLTTGTVITRAMVIESPATAGKVTYTWVAADWNALVSGVHLMEYRVAGTGDAQLTFPNHGYDRLEVDAEA